MLCYYFADRQPLEKQLSTFEPIERYGCCDNVLFSENGDLYERSGELSKTIVQIEHLEELLLSLQFIFGQQALHSTRRHKEEATERLPTAFARGGWCSADVKAEPPMNSKQGLTEPSIVSWVAWI